MNDLRRIYIPISIELLEQVQVTLQNPIPIVAGFNLPRRDLFNPATYIEQKAYNNHGFVLFADRNLIARCSEILRGEAISQIHRTAAALMAFCQVSKIEIEPDIAFYELSSCKGSEVAANELELFHRGIRLHPGHWAEVSAGITDSLSEVVDYSHQQTQPASIYDLSSTPRIWHNLYAVALKIGAIALKRGHTVEALLSLFEWMESTFLYSRVGMLIGLRYFSLSSQRKGIFPGLRSENRARAIRGVQNMSWDMTILHIFLHHCINAEGGRLHLLGSFDRQLLRTASSVIPAAETMDADSCEAISMLISSSWPTDSAEEIAREITALQSRISSPNRVHMRQSYERPIMEIIAELENEVFCSPPT